MTFNSERIRKKKLIKKYRRVYAQRRPINLNHATRVREIDYLIERFVVECEKQKLILRTICKHAFPKRLPGKYGNNFHQKIPRKPVTHNARDT